MAGCTLANHRFVDEAMTKKLNHMKDKAIKDAALETVKYWSQGQELSIALAPVLALLKEYYPEDYKCAFRRGWNEGTDSRHK